MSKKMIADMPFTYGRKALKPGDDFVASDQDSIALRAFRRAHLADDEPEPKRTRSKRTYKRRDMTAESP